MYLAWEARKNTLQGNHLHLGKRDSEGLIRRFVLMLSDFYKEIGEAGTIPGLDNVKKLGEVD